MEKRVAKRITAGYKATVTYCDKRYTGVIENLSELGVNVLTETMETMADFRAGESVDLLVETPSGEQLVLNCRIKWSKKIPPRNAKSRIGLEIVNPPWEKIRSFL